MDKEWTQLPFTEAIDYFKDKTPIDTDSYIEGQGITQDVAFTVAKAKGDLLTELKDAVGVAISNGQSVEAFQKVFGQIADRWSSDWLGNGNRAWRSQLIYESNLRTAYAAGRYKQMTEPAVLEKRPYWQWKHGGSRRPRPAHLALNGKVLSANDIFFSAGGFPPCGFSCRCKVFSLTPTDLSDRGLLLSEAPEADSVIDPNWNFIPGKNDRSKTISELPESIRKLVEKEASK